MRSLGAHCVVSRTRDSTSSSDGAKTDCEPRVMWAMDDSPTLLGAGRIDDLTCTWEEGGYRTRTGIPSRGQPREKPRFLYM